MVLYNISAGHNPDGKIGCGAVGLIKESTEARWIVNRIMKLYKNNKVNMYVSNCTTNTGISQRDILEKICRKHNLMDCFLNISIHFNSGRNDTKGDNKVGGCEVYYVSNRGKYFAEKFAAGIAQLGFTNRGAKFRNDLYFLNHTNDTAILIEVCFVDDKDDVELYNKKKNKIAKKIFKIMKREAMVK